MNTIEGFPYFEFEVGKDGQVIDPAARAEALAYFGSGKASDLLVISHGWNNDMAEARDLYQPLHGRTAPAGGRTGRRHCLAAAWAVLGVLWPSKKFAEKDLIPGQAAAA